MCDNLLTELTNAMHEPDPPLVIQSSLQTNPRKRPREISDTGDDTTAEAFSSTQEIPATAATPNQNVTTYARTIAAMRGLEDDLSGELLEFAMDSDNARKIKAQALQLAIYQELRKIVRSQPAFVPTRKTLINIKGTVMHVLLSSKLKQYKGKGPHKATMEIIKQRRFDLPEGLEKNHAEWSQIESLVSDALTQFRGKIKKLIIKSVEAPQDTDKWTIMQLAEKVVAKSNIKICWPVLARLAVMRGVYTQLGSGDRKYWDKLDVFLGTIRANAKHDETLVHKAFAKAVEADRAKYGTASAGSLENIESGDVNDPKMMDFEYQDDDGSESDSGEGSEAT